MCVTLSVRSLCTVLWRMAARHPDALSLLLLSVIDDETADVIVTRFVALSSPVCTGCRCAHGRKRVCVCVSVHLYVCVRVCRWDNMELCECDSPPADSDGVLCWDCVQSLREPSGVREGGGPVDTLTVVSAANLPDFFDDFYDVFAKPDDVMALLSSARERLARNSLLSVCSTLADEPLVFAPLPPPSAPAVK